MSVPSNAVCSLGYNSQNSLVKPDDNVVPGGRLVIEEVGVSVAVGRLEMKVEVSVEDMDVSVDVVIGAGAGVVEVVVVGTGAGEALVVVVTGTVVRVLGVVVVEGISLVVDAGAEVGDNFGWGVNVSVWP